MKCSLPIRKFCTAQRPTNRSPFPWTEHKATSGTTSPALGVGVALGYVPVSHAPGKQNTGGLEVEVEIRGKAIPATVTSIVRWKSPTTRSHSGRMIGRFISSRRSF